jgi:GMP synthase (glutamine-hydrolysing)
VLLPVKTVGVMGDGRTYDSVAPARRDLDRRHDRRHLSLRRRLPSRVATRIINEVKGINRVVYDYEQAARHDRVGMIFAHPGVSENTP